MFVTGPKVVEVCQFSMTAYGTVSERDHNYVKQGTCMYIKISPGGNTLSVDFLVSRK